MSDIDRKSKVVVIGSTGLIGAQVVRWLTAGARAERYQVLGVTHQTSPGLDLEAPASIAAFFDAHRGVDHVIVAAGAARFGGFDALDAGAFEVGLRSKLMGQVNVAMAALRTLPRGGSVTLTSGELSRAPIPGSAAVALVNGALDSFVRAIALDAPAERRVNVVSPGWISETRARMGLDPGHGVPARDVARLYLTALEGDLHGQVVTAATAG
ncbi:MAG: short chain dehydrogenase [Deltaproteobacteria bacterium HGW-Deltaproteobacteria-14]|jgi:NADP-dependent 3-hydroxy acid dehydrogenase YdfG|nr:MAG: short chain dehydrogenase [Deltaproteobacteria bacterium HGW-Deltaproteobacteria-14]